MAEVSDIGWIALGAAVVALFAWYFWHTAVAMVGYIKSVHHFVETRNERLKQEIAYEAMHGRKPIWYRAVQRLMILIVIAGSAALIWTKFKGA